MPLSMDFVHIERGWGRTLVLLPGWGFLAEIFSRLSLPYDYILPAGPLAGDVSEDIAEFLYRTGVSRTTLLGWSLGAYLAVDFAKRYPEKTSSLLLVSLRTAFCISEIELVRALVEADPEGTLRDFYRRCFAGQKGDYRWFVECYEKRFIKAIKKVELLDGLSYLSSRTIDLDRIPCRDILIVHGARDLISPAHLVPRLPHLRFFLIPGTGHLPFLSPEFGRILFGNP